MAYSAGASFNTDKVIWFYQLRRLSVSFRISLRWPIHIINPIDKTKLSRNIQHTPRRRSTAVSSETYPFVLFIPTDSLDSSKFQSKIETHCFTRRPPHHRRRICISPLSNKAVLHWTVRLDSKICSQNISEIFSVITHFELKKRILQQKKIVINAYRFCRTRFL